MCMRTVWVLYSMSGRKGVRKSVREREQERFAKENSFSSSDTIGVQKLCDYHLKRQLSCFQSPLVSLLLIHCLTLPISIYFCLIKVFSCSSLHDHMHPCIRVPIQIVISVQRFLGLLSDNNVTWHHFAINM